jgi:hypothetical protein
MADPKTALERLIAEHGGVLVRQRKHKVWKFPTGVVITVSSTPEDSRGEINALACVRNLLGVNPPNRGTPGERREKRVKRKSDVGTLLPSTLHDITTGDLKMMLAAVKSDVPKPQHTKPSKTIKHPQHNLVAKPATQPAIELLHIRFGTQV